MDDSKSWADSVLGSVRSTLLGRRRAVYSILVLTLLTYVLAPSVLWLNLSWLAILIIALGVFLPGAAIRRMFALPKQFIWLFYAFLIGIGIQIAHFVVDVSTEEAFALSLYDDSIVALMIIAPILEEVYYRGFLFGILSVSGHGPVLSVGLSSIVFALAHTTFGFDDFIGAFVMGIVSNILLIHWRSLWVSIACHMGANVLPVWAIHFYGVD